MSSCILENRQPSTPAQLSCNLTVSADFRLTTGQISPIISQNIQIQRKSRMDSHLKCHCFLQNTSAGVLEFRGRQMCTPAKKEVPRDTEIPRVRIKFIRIDDQPSTPQTPAESPPRSCSHETWHSEKFREPHRIYLQQLDDAVNRPGRSRNQMRDPRRW